MIICCHFLRFLTPFDTKSLFVLYLNLVISPYQAFGGQLRDLVVSASPANPPLSLLVLADQLADQYRLLASSHVHSSASTDTSRLFAYIAPQLRRAFSTRSAVSNRAEYQLVLTVIWKQGT